MTRKIKGLRWVKPMASGPFGRGRSPRGAKAQGLRYERNLGKALGPCWRHGQWIEFEDSNGPGWAQADFLGIGKTKLVVLEAKYTWVPEALCQLDWLYRPLCEAIWGLPTQGFVVCKNLTNGQSGHLWRSLDLMIANGNHLDCLHWIGTGPLGEVFDRKGLTMRAISPQNLPQQRAKGLV